MKWSFSSRKPHQGCSFPPAVRYRALAVRVCFSCRTVVLSCCQEVTGRKAESSKKHLLLWEIWSSALITIILGSISATSGIQLDDTSCKSYLNKTWNGFVVLCFNWHVFLSLFSFEFKSSRSTEVLKSPIRQRREDPQTVLFKLACIICNASYVQLSIGSTCRMFGWPGSTTLSYRSCNHKKSARRKLR